MVKPNDQLRVLHIASGDLWAGAEAQVATLLSHLRQDPSIQLHAVILNPGELARRLDAAGIDVTILDEGRLSSVAILGAVRKLIRSWDPGVIHTHRTKENVIGGLAARLEGGRTSLRTAHGASEIAASMWRLDKRLFRALDYWSCVHWQQAVVAVSTDLARRLRMQIKSCNFEVIHNGLDVAELGPQRERHKARIASGFRRVGFVGRLVQVKRLDLVLATAAVLNCREAGAWQFDVVGDGPLRRELETLASGLGLADCVEFLGFRTDVADRLASFDVLIFTSDHEGMPMAALEALAVGVPVVARAVGGLVELLEGLQGCRLVDSDQPEALANAVESVLESAERKEVCLPQRYHIQTCARKYLELYRRLLRR